MKTRGWGGGQIPPLRGCRGDAHLLWLCACGHRHRQGRLWLWSLCFLLTSGAGLKTKAEKHCGDKGSQRLTAHFSFKKCIALGAWGPSSDSVLQCPTMDTTSLTTVLPSQDHCPQHPGVAGDCEAGLPPRPHPPTAAWPARPLSSQAVAHSTPGSPKRKWPCAPEPHFWDQK